MPDSEFISIINTGTYVNNYNGYVGFTFSPKSYLVVSSLGRYVLTGNTGVHNVSLSGTDCNVIVQIDCSSGTTGQFTYTDLPTLIYLTSGTTYYLRSLEISGVDDFLDDNSTITGSSGTFINSVSGTTNAAGAGYAYGISNFKYHVLDLSSGGKDISVTQTPDMCIGRLTINKLYLFEGDSHKSVCGGRDDNEYYSSPPSLKMDAAGVLAFPINFVSGERLISVAVKQAANKNPRPSIYIKPNSSIGITGISGSAAASTDWVTIGPLSVSATASGISMLELHNNYLAQLGGAPCYWDAIAIV